MTIHSRHAHARALFLERCPQCGRPARAAEVAPATGTDTLVNICHYCKQVFAKQATCPEGRQQMEVVNHASLVAQGLGIHREDLFRRYALERNVAAIP